MTSTRCIWRWWRLSPTRSSMPIREPQPGPIDFALSLLDDGRVECVVTDYGSWRPPAEAEDDRGNGLMVARHLVDEMQVTHPGPKPGPTAGQAGTVVTLRHHLMRPVIMLADESAQPALFGAETGFGVITEPGQRRRASARPRRHRHHDGGSAAAPAARCLQGRHAAADGRPHRRHPAR